MKLKEKISDLAAVLKRIAEKIAEDSISIELPLIFQNKEGSYLEDLDLGYYPCRIPGVIHINYMVCTFKTMWNKSE